MISKNDETIKTLKNALNNIVRFGGNQSDDSLMTRTGPNDAASRGIMYVNAREIAREALSKLKN